MILRSGTRDATCGSKIMNKDQIKGRAEQVAGKAKKTAGKLMQDSALKEKGRMEEAAGKARATYGDTKEEWKQADESDK
jgi:uncharacterized protein YjbJ (UPF0337 family)